MIDNKKLALKSRYEHEGMFLAYFTGESKIDIRHDRYYDDLKHVACATVIFIEEFNEHDVGLLDKKNPLSRINEDIRHEARIVVRSEPKASG